MSTTNLARSNTMFSTGTRSTLSAAPPKTLILCFDGTANQPNERGTNIGKLFFALEKEHLEHQMCYYQPGIGTYVPANSLLKPLSGIAKTVDFAIAWYLKEHIVSGYRFLMDNYRAGDKIVMFGFSRGAYTTRALAAMLARVGLLYKGHEETIGLAYDNYIKSGGQQGTTDAASQEYFRNGFSRAVVVEFVGVWDTVASCGLSGQVLPGALSSSIAHHFRHALALDERRAKFGAMTAHIDSAADVGSFNPVMQATKVLGSIKKPSFFGSSSKQQTPEAPQAEAPSEKTLDTLYEDSVGQNLASSKEVWFIGCHSDVGGSLKHIPGSPALANVTLFWMLQELQALGIELLFKEEAFNRNAAIELTILNPALASGLVSNVLRGTEPEGMDETQAYQFKRAAIALRADVCDSDINESLKGSWYLLELIPKDMSLGGIIPNYGQGRRIRGTEKPLFHWSVALRRKMKNYTPQANSDIQPDFVDDGEDKVVTKMWQPFTQPPW